MSCSYLLGLLGACALGLPTTITGPATVYDGDTIYVQHQSIRLFGVDAEELSEPNGRRARDTLQHIIGMESVTCRLTGDRSYSRLIARCYARGTDGKDNSHNEIEINRAIIASGWALDCATYSSGRYRKDEPAGARARLIQKPYC